MILLNKVAYDFVPGTSLKELVGMYNSNHPAQLGFNDFIVIVNSVAIDAAQAPDRVLQDNDNIFIVPVMDGG